MSKKATYKFTRKEILQKVIDIELKIIQYDLLIKRFKSRKGLCINLYDECRKRITNLKKQKKELANEINRIIDKWE